jgi:hypothetical protein
VIFNSISEVVAWPGSGRWIVGTVSVSIVPTAGCCAPTVVLVGAAADDAAVFGDVEVLGAVEVDGKVGIAGLLLPTDEA